jgi:hypothetical protein
MKMKITLILILAVACMPMVGFADDRAQPMNELVLLGGVADIRRSNNTLPFGAVQVRFAPNWYGIHPYAQVGYESGGSVIGLGGILYNLLLPGKFSDLRLTLGTGPGVYAHKGGSTNLGNTVEFYSWVELSLPVLAHRVGVSFSHISNAHLSHHNPGIDGVNASIVALTW